MNRRLTLFLILSIICSTLFPIHVKEASASDILPFIVLSDYQKELAIHEDFSLIAFTSNGTIPKFKSSSSRIASVNTYGKITAKKAGTATITVKIKNAEASCKVTVQKTAIALEKSSASIERNESYQIKVKTSNGSLPTFKCNKSSVALVDETGCILGMKPGQAVITIKADGSTVRFSLTVKQPTVTLNKTKLTLYRGESSQLTARVSSNAFPKYTSSRSKVAAIDASGTITALKHGTATIRVKVDGITKLCEVTVKSPDIYLETQTIELKPGDTFSLNPVVSSGNLPSYKSSNTAVATVSEDGKITAQTKGHAIVTVSEDGTKVKCKITVTN
ncbi:MAG: hypothetical protein PWP24_429 [Clostridiales bacterium]|nr:hypothetical protein [Clostridiales bacterium]